MRPGYGYAGPARPESRRAGPGGLGHLSRRPGDGRSSELIVSLADIAKIPIRAATWRRPSTTSTTCWSAPTARGSSSCTAGGLPDWRGAHAHVHRRHGRHRHSRHRSVRQARRISSGAIRRAHPGLVAAARTATGRLLPVRGPARAAASSRSAPGVMTNNGHCTYLPGNEWILNDTYPQGQSVCRPRTCTTSPPDDKWSWATSFTSGVSRRVALRHAPALQSRRAAGGDRFDTHGAGAAVISDRHWRVAMRNSGR